MRCSLIVFVGVSLTIGLFAAASAACPTIAGYDLAADTDHYGDDIACDIISVATAIRRCTRDAKCKAFNTYVVNGVAWACTKKISVPTAPASGICFYTKAPASSCPQVSGYTLAANTDHYGNDIVCAPTTTATAASRCTASSACKAFNTYKVNGTSWACTKKVSGPTAPLKGICFYTKVVAGCPQVVGYSVSRSIDHYGDDISCSTSDRAAAASSCTGNNDCKAFNTFLVDGVPWACTKRVSGPTSPSSASGICFYAKNGAPDPPSDCVPLWSDEFNGATLDRSNWGFFLGKAYNNELQYYTDRTDNVRLENGNLVLEARSESYGGMRYTSGRLESDGKRAFAPGMVVDGKVYPKIRVESRMWLPKGQGMWPAFWMMPQDEPYGGWPWSGELDIMEGVNNMDTLYSTLHFISGGQRSSLQGRISRNLGLEWHTYAVDWEATQMTFSLDGVPYATLKSSSVDPNGWRTTSRTSKPTGPNSPFDVPYYIILNLAVGGDWPGSPDARTVFPARVLVDFVRVAGCP